MLTVLKSKLKKVYVTESNVNYEGSITIDEDLMDAANLAEYELVHVNGLNGNRIITYVIKGKRGSGVICMNGGASLHFKVGDEVHVLAFENSSYFGRTPPKIIHTDKNNKVI